MSNRTYPTPRRSANIPTIPNITENILRSASENEADHIALLFIHLEKGTTVYHRETTIAIEHSSRPSMRERCNWEMSDKTRTIRKYFAHRGFDFMI